MLNFEFYSPTKIYFGRNREQEVGKIIKDYGYKKVLIHYGQSSIKKMGLYDKVVQSLTTNEIEYYELGGVSPNPKIDIVYEAVKICKEKQIDLILAVGGGSVIDSAKSCAVGACTNQDPWRFNLQEIKPEKALPVGVILTISAAGSELSNSCVISNLDGGWKRGFNNDLIRPIFAIMNPELTFTVSKFQTGCGIVDILMHTLERYFSDVPNVELTDRISEGLMKAVIKAGSDAIEKPNDYEARATLMLASSLSHNGLTGLGGKTYFTVHRIEHEISGMYDRVAHGAGLSVLFPAWAKYVYQDYLDKFAQFAYEVMGVDKTISSKQAAKEGINRLESFFKSIGMPTSLTELNINEDSFSEMALKAIGKNQHLAGIIPLNQKMIIDIFKLAK